MVRGEGRDKPDSERARVREPDASKYGMFSFNTEYSPDHKAKKVSDDFFRRSCLR